MFVPATPPPPPRIATAPGWVLVRSGPSFSPSMVVAVRARDSARVRPFALFGSMKRLSPAGVLVWASTIGRGRPGFPRMAWPARLPPDGVAAAALELPRRPRLGGAVGPERPAAAPVRLRRRLGPRRARL